MQPQPVHLPSLLAPMEGFTTFPFRLWLHMVSAPGSMTTPFLRVTAQYPEREVPADFAPELGILRGALPYTLIPQFITGDPEQFRRAAELVPESWAPYLEINCGCPSPNALGRLAGSGMLQDPEAFGRSIEALVKARGVGRLAVKMRIGIEDPAEFPALLRAIAQLPLARLSVHGRTRADGYRGQARWDVIKAASEGTATPLIASGDILGHATRTQLQQLAPRLAGLMIGRGALRNPWVFAELATARPVQIGFFSFVNALLCYALLQELWHEQPAKLLGRVARGRIGAYCGTDFAAWERLTVELTSLVFGYPFLLLKADALASLSLSSVAFARLRLLWSYLRSSLPPEFADPRLLRCKGAHEFFQRLFMLGEPWHAADGKIELRHQLEWDAHFARARG